MSVLVYAENSGGKFKKTVFEAATYASDLAKSLNTSCVAISIGDVPDSELEHLGKYGVSKVLHVSNDRLKSFVNMAYASVIASAAKSINATAVVLSQTYNGRAVAPRIAVKLNGAQLSGVTTLVTSKDNGFVANRGAFSGKAIEEIFTDKLPMVITVRANSHQIVDNLVSCSIEPFTGEPDNNDFAAIAKEIIKASDKISLTEADIVVSAGRGLKDPSNWGMIEELAGLLGAATACSKPVADVGWRPHYEHVGQTGIQVAPNLYFAIGISGAIQHLAGISASKIIVVINIDPEAPFFKIADFGIVGDAFVVIPKLIEAIKAIKK